MAMNRNYKDSVFSCYFSEDPRRLIELYNAIEGTNYPLDTKIELNTLDDVLYKDRINDLSFVLDGQLVVLIEHQSTINRNMALRMLIYLGRLYEKLLPSEVLYRSKTVPIPTPKFIVLYNGTGQQPQHTQQRLSEAFMVKEDCPMAELIVDIWNVNYGEDIEVIQKCRSLEEYSLFVSLVRAERHKGTTFETAVTNAIRYCIQHDIMQEFLRQHGSEVENMLFTEWNWDDALRVSREEGHEEGRAEGIEQGMQRGAMKTLCDLVVSGVLAWTDAVKNAGMPQAEFMGWMKQFHPDYPC